MPEVVRGSRASIDEPRPSVQQSRGVRFDTVPETEDDPPRPPLTTHESGSAGSGLRRKSTDINRNFERRPTIRPEDRPEAEAYYDSRAATKREFKRRASTLQDYYKLHPTLLPQLPFTWHHGWRRWKLFFLIFLIFVDACAMPIVLFYAMKYAGHVQGWIIFAIITTIWGGPTYLEFAVRSWRLMKKEDFFRPLGTRSRWAFDYVHWVSTAAIAAVTALFIVGSAPHIVWLRVLSIPAPALILVLGIGILLPTFLNVTGRTAPFRISSSDKGEHVYPGVLYIMEDIVAVNANAGRPFREAVHARYHASPRFRRMCLNQSWFWGIPAVAIGAALIVVACVHTVPRPVAYGLGWGIPFVWAGIWGVFSVMWCKRDMRMERQAWEMDNSDGIQAEKKLANLEAGSDGERGSEQTAVASAAQTPSEEKSSPARKGSLKKLRAYLDGDQTVSEKVRSPEKTLTSPPQADPEAEKVQQEEQPVPASEKAEQEEEKEQPMPEHSPDETNAETDAAKPEAHPTQPEIDPPSPKTDEKVVGAGV